MLLLCYGVVVVIGVVVVASVLDASVVLRQSVFCVFLRVLWVVKQFVIVTFPGPYSLTFLSCERLTILDQRVYNTASGLKNKLQLL